MATSKTLAPTNVTISIPEFTDKPDQRVNSNCIDKEADAINALDSKIPNPVNTSSGFNRTEIFGSSSSNIMILRSYIDSGSDYLQFVLHANNGWARVTKSVGGTETTLMELALKSDVKKKTYTNITTSASGNASFEDLLTTNTIVLAVVCTTDAASVCIPYRNNATYNRWGVHVITDNASNTTKTNTTLSFEVYYRDI